MPSNPPLHQFELDFQYFYGSSCISLNETHTWNVKLPHNNDWFLILSHTFIQYYGPLQKRGNVL